MDLLGLIGFLFGYFGVPIMLLAAMVSVTVSYGFIIGSVFAAGFSIYTVALLKIMGQPVKCGICVFIKAFIILALPLIGWVDFILHPQDRDQVHQGESR